MIRSVTRLDRCPMGTRPRPFVWQGWPYGMPCSQSRRLSMLHSIAAVLRYLGVIRLRGCPQNHLKGLTMRRMQAILINASAEATLTS